MGRKEDIKIVRGKQLQAEIRQRELAAAENKEAKKQFVMKNNTIARRTKWIFLAAAVFCGIFAAVYEMFSHDVISYSMILSGLIPLLGGFVPMLLLQLYGNGRKFPGCISRYSWYSSVAIFTIACILKGVLDIYGTTNSKLKFYWLFGTILGALAILCWLFTMFIGGRRNRHSNLKWTYRVISMFLIIGFTIYFVLDTFVIVRVYSHLDDETEETTSVIDGQTEETTTFNNETDSDTKVPVVITPDSYSDGEITISIEQYREYDTDIYVADIQINSIEYLKTAFAQNSYGKNVTETTSEIAQEVEAILAINGDYYGSREEGYVIRNGVIYRDEAGDGREDLAIMTDGSFKVFSEDDVTAQEILDEGALQVFSFGPGLVNDGDIAVSEDQEVGKAKASNPRTAIGMIEPGHYVAVVSDGRTDESEGLSLYNLAEFMKGLGVETGYNLDGGGSSTLYFNGEVINNPTTNGNTIKERSISDIVYIAE